MAGKSAVRVAGKTPRRRLLALLKRDGAACVWCDTALTAEHPEALCARLVRATAGGTGRLGNFVASCARCHALRGGLTAAHWLLVCLDRDVRPNFAAVERLLASAATQVA